jgi:hypothetical protein
MTTASASCSPCENAARGRTRRSKLVVDPTRGGRRTTSTPPTAKSSCPTSRSSSRTRSKCCSRPASLSPAASSAAAARRSIVPSPRRATHSESTWRTGSLRTSRRCAAGSMPAQTTAIGIASRATSSTARMVWRRMRGTSNGARSSRAMRRRQAFPRRGPVDGRCCRLAPRKRLRTPQHRRAGRAMPGARALRLHGSTHGVGAQGSTQRRRRRRSTSSGPEYEPRARCTRSRVAAGESTHSVKPGSASVAASGAFPGRCP